MSLSRVTWKKLAKLRRLPAADRRLLSAAAAWLLLVDLALRVLGFARVRRLLAGKRRADPDAAGGEGRRREAERVARAVAVAAHHHLYPMRCLPRSLVLWRLLARRGIPAELRIGVRKEGPELEAHAWVEQGGRPLGEGDDPRYATLPLPAP